MKGAPVDAHGDRVPSTGLGDDQVDVPGPERRERVGGQEVDHVDLPAEKSVYLALLARVVADDQFVRIGLAVLPVVVVAGEDALHSSSEALVLERSCPDWVLRVIAGRDHQAERVDEGLDERRERRRARDLKGERVEDLRVRQVERRETDRAGERHFRVHDPAQAEEYVRRAEALAVVADHVGSDLDRPLGGARVRGDRLGESERDARSIGAEVRKRVVERVDTRIVAVGQRVHRVEVVVTRSALAAEVQRPATLGLAGRGCRRSTRATNCMR